MDFSTPPPPSNIFPTRQILAWFYRRNHEAKPKRLIFNDRCTRFPKGNCEFVKCFMAIFYSIFADDVRMLCASIHFTFFVK